MSTGVGLFCVAIAIVLVGIAVVGEMKKSRLLKAEIEHSKYTQERAYLLLETSKYDNDAQERAWRRRFDEEMALLQVRSEAYRLQLDDDRYENISSGFLIKERGNYLDMLQTKIEESSTVTNG